MAIKFSETILGMARELSLVPIYPSMNIITYLFGLLVWFRNLILSHKLLHAM